MRDRGTANQLVVTDAQQTVEWVERECAECLHDFKIPKTLADMGPNLCPECRDPPEIDFSRLSLWPGSALPDEPLMEFGPMSHSRSGGKDA